VKPPGMGLQNDGCNEKQGRGCFFQHGVTSPRGLWRKVQTMAG
jgi:hypothetical protein